MLTREDLHIAGKLTLRNLLFPTVGKWRSGSRSGKLATCICANFNREVGRMLYQDVGTRVGWV